MKTAIESGVVITPREEVREAVILIEDGIVQQVTVRTQAEIPKDARTVEWKDLTIVPGFVDTHVHGGAGRDVMEASDEALCTIAASLFRHGTVAFYPTTVTASREQTLQTVAYLGKAIHRIEKNELPGFDKDRMAIPLGIHLEGPFISPEKRGTHPTQFITLPSKEFLNELLDASDERVEILTVAPEVEGAVEFIQYARSLDLRVGIGHSNATFEEAERAIQSGATHAIHLFNAMRSWNQREPGIVGAALADPRLSCEIIGDGVHVHPLNVRIALRQKTFEKILAITDATSATAMPDGRYKLAGFEIDVKNGVCIGPGGMLAGSTLTQERAVQHFVEWHCCSFREAVQTATLNTAALMGMESHWGRIAQGTAAKFNLYDEHQTFRESVCF